jgi:hypothetical protein
MDPNAMYNEMYKSVIYGKCMVLLSEELIMPYDSEQTPERLVSSNP